MTVLRDHDALDIPPITMPCACPDDTMRGEAAGIGAGASTCGGSHRHRISARPVQMCRGSLPCGVRRSFLGSHS